MPVARGIMQIGRITIQPTTISFSIDPTSPINCQEGETITFDVSVGSIAGTPTGTIGVIDILIKDLLTNEIVGFGTIDSFGNATIPIQLPISEGDKEFAAFYLGKLNEYGPSNSTRRSYRINPNPTTTNIIAPTIPYYFCKNYDFSISSETSSAFGNPDGYTSFLYWLNNSDGYLIGNSLLDGYNTSNLLIPAGTVKENTSIYLQSIYLGETCFNTSSSPFGTSGTLINQTSSNTTTTILSIVGSSTFCIDQPFILNATVTSSNFPNPDVGFVTFFALQNGGFISFQIGQTVNVDSGLASIVIPANTFSESDIYYLRAVYSGDDFCFNASSSPTGTSGLAVNPILCS
jgi:hypothetical protein